MSVLVSHLITTVPIYATFAYILWPRRTREGDHQ